MLTRDNSCETRLNEVILRTNSLFERISRASAMKIAESVWTNEFQLCYLVIFFFPGDLELSVWMPNYASRLTPFIYTPSLGSLSFCQFSSIISSNRPSRCAYDNSLSCKQENTSTKILLSKNHAKEMNKVRIGKLPATCSKIC